MAKLDSILLARTVPVACGRWETGGTKPSRKVTFIARRRALHTVVPPVTVVHSVVAILNPLAKTGAQVGPITRRGASLGIGFDLKMQQVDVHEAH